MCKDVCEKLNFQLVDRPKSLPFVCEEMSVTNLERSQLILESTYESYKQQYGESFDCPPPPELSSPLTGRDDEQYAISSWEKPLDFRNLSANVKEVFIDSCCSDNHSWKLLAGILESPARETIVELHLGHDGLIDADHVTMTNVLRGLPSLKEITYCGYYADFEDELQKLAQELGITCTPQY